MDLSEKEVSIGLSPTYYGNNSITEAFISREIAFELEVKTKTSSHREIIDLNQVLRLQKQIEQALIYYDAFHKSPSHGSNVKDESIFDFL